MIRKTNTVLSMTGLNMFDVVNSDMEGVVKEQNKN